MALSLRTKKEFNDYVVNSLIEKFNYSKEEAIEMIRKSTLMEEFEKFPQKVLYFNSEFWAAKLVKRSKIN